MTIDWFVALTPVVLLLVALPVLFVGCTRFTAGQGDPPTPDPEPETPPGPPPDPPPVPPPVRTSFRLEMDPNLQVNLASPVVRIVVQWSLESSTGGLAPLLVPQPATVITTRKVPPPNPPAIDPITDLGAKGDVPSDDIGTRDKVRCVCTVFLANETTPNVAGTQRQENLQKDRTHEFRIQSRGPNLPGFRVYVNGA